MWHSRPPPFMAKAILNFHFDYLTPSLMLKRSIQKMYDLRICHILSIVHHLPILVLANLLLNLICEFISVNFELV